MGRLKVEKLGLGVKRETESEKTSRFDFFCYLGEEIKIFVDILIIIDVCGFGKRFFFKVVFVDFREVALVCNCFVNFGFYLECRVFVVNYFDYLSSGV